MPLSGALFSSVSGLDVMSTAISVTGDNIANVGTPGFKARRAEFADVLGQSISTAGGFSQLGAGAKLANVRPQFSQGTFETTARPTDVAIEGRGFFVVDGPLGRFYTRAGIFNFDENGTLVSNDGLRVQGFGIDPVTQQSTGALGDIQISSSLAPPRATTEVTMSVNLDSRAPTVGPFDPSDPQGTSNFQNTVTVFDSLGNAHTAFLYFTNQGSGTWEWNAALDVNDTSTAPASPGDSIVVQGSGTLSFDSNGALTGVTGSPVSFAWNSGATSPQDIALDFGLGTTDASTQFGVASGVNFMNQDGFAAGNLTGISINREGFVTGQFSNGATLNLAQLALANFSNVEGLQTIGNNNLQESPESGQPLIGAPLTGSLGSIRASSIEQSNVDLASEFVKLIVNQRAFQANTRTISVTNELLANLVALGQ